MIADFHRIGDLNKLVRLQKMHTRKAEMEYKKSLDEVERIEKATNVRRTRIDKLKVELSSLLSHGTVDEIQQSIQFSAYLFEKKSELDNDLERDEFWYKDDLQELDGAEKALEKSRKNWMLFRSKEMNIQVLLKNSRNSLLRKQENRLEMEADDLISARAGSK